MKIVLVSQKLNSVDQELALEHIRQQFGEDIPYTLIYPKDGNSYKIDEIKGINTAQTRKPNDNQHIPMYVFMQAHTMTHICQNALLKTLEESPYSISLITRNLDALLPTIRSRCQVIYDVTYEDVAQSVEDISLVYSAIPELAKFERAKLKSLLEQKLVSTDGTNYEAILFLQEAIKKIEANCKLDSVLYELVNKIDNIK